MTVGGRTAGWDDDDGFGTTTVLLPLDVKDGAVIVLFWFVLFEGKDDGNAARFGPCTVATGAIWGAVDIVLIILERDCKRRIAAVRLALLVAVDVVGLAVVDGEAEVAVVVVLFVFGVVLVVVVVVPVVVLDLLGVVVVVAVVVGLFGVDEDDDFVGVFDDTEEARVDKAG